MSVNCWQILGHWLAAQARRSFRWCPVRRRQQVQRWSGSRQAAPLAVEVLEARTLLTGEAFLLHSLPGGTKRIYLDFNGHTTTGTDWNQAYDGNGPNHSIISTPFSLDGNTSTFSAEEEELITQIWRVVSEDFAPFGVDVTTQDPGVLALRKSALGDNEWGIRVVIGGNSDWYPNDDSVGVAYIDSFTDDTDTPAFVFADRLSDYYAPAPFLPYVDTISHEVGHTLGLEHDGISTNQTFGSASEYYYGHYAPADGDLIWAPIMGSPITYDYILSQWSNGNYAGATEHQDDLAIITSQNGFDYRPDDHGNGTEEADELTIIDPHLATASGIIERRSDADYFRFFVEQGGTVHIHFGSALSPYFEDFDAIVSDLDILGTLYDSEGQVIASDNPEDWVEASLTLELDPGIYYLSIDGVGLGNPLDSGYSDYGSLGQYTISVSTTTGIVSHHYPNVAPADISLNDTLIAENSALGAVVGTLSSTDENENDTFTYSLAVGAGDTDNANFAISGNKLVTNAQFDFEQQTSYSVRIRTTDQDGLTFEKSFSITVTNVNDPPTGLALSSSSIVENNLNPGIVGTLSATDVDSAGSLTFALTPGIGSTDNPSFSVVGDTLQINTTTNFEVKSSYTIRLKVTDQGGAIFSKQFTIQVTNVAEAPTDLAVSTPLLSENNVSNIVVGTLIATDGDPGSSFTFSLISGLGDDDNGSFTVDGNSLRITPVTDFEVKNSYSVRLRVTDEAGLTFEKPLTVTIGDQNESPTELSLSASTLAENNAPGASIGTLSATDPDFGATFTFGLAAGTGDDDNGSFAIVGNALVMVGSADFETQDLYSVRLRVTDQGGLSFQKEFAITITDAVDPPHDIDLSSTDVLENNPIGTEVGLLSAQDTDSSSFSFALVSGPGGEDNGSFSIVGDALLILPTADFETQDTYSIRVRATDEGGLSYDEVLEIDVINENEAPSDIRLTLSYASEYNPGLLQAGTLSAVDPDADDFDTFTLIDGVGSTDNGTFSIIDNQLWIDIPADFAPEDTYSILIRVTDQGGLTFDKSFDFDFIDRNDAPTSLILIAASIAENDQPNTIAGTFVATDPDAGDTFTYHLVAGTGSIDNGAFEIIDDQLLFSLTADYEAKSSYSIRVAVQDQDDLAYEAVITINISDVNEAPTDILLSTSSVTENTGVGTEVAVLSALDADAGDSFTFALIAGPGSDDNAAFLIDGASLVINTGANFEWQDSYSIRVQVTDHDGLTVEKSLTIEVMDENEPPTVAPGQSFSISEGVLDGATVGTVVGTDPDSTAPNNTLTYAIISGNFGNVFAIDPSTGAISVNDHSVLDFETTAQYSLEVMVTDGGPGLLTASEVVVIDVTNANDAPTFADSATLSIPEHSPLNTPLGSVVATDPDGDALVFSIVAGNAGSALAIDSSSGLLTVADPVALDFETSPTLILTIQVQDQFGLTATTDVTINVTDIDDSRELQVGDEPVTWINRRAPSVVLPDIAITGLESIGGGSLTITVNTVGTARKAMDRFTVPRYGSLGTSSGLHYGNGQTTMQIQLNPDVTASQIQTFLRGITFSTRGKGFKVSTRTVTVTLTDGFGSTSTLSQTVNVRKKA